MRELQDVGWPDDRRLFSSIYPTAVAKMKRMNKSGAPDQIAMNLALSGCAAQMHGRRLRSTWAKRVGDK